jgi:VanZ family protein
MKPAMSRVYPTWLRSLARGTTVLYAVAVIVLSLIPGKDVPMGEISDKYRHAAAYGVFAMLVSASFLGPRWWPIAMAFVIVSAFGLTIEYIQPSFHRSFDYGDAMANSIGAAVGCGLLLLIRFLTLRRLALSPVNS